MTADLQRCRDEQIRCVTLLLAGHTEQHGLEMAVNDNFAEDLLLTGHPVLVHDELERQGLRIPASE